MPLTSLSIDLNRRHKNIFNKSKCSIDFIIEAQKKIAMIKASWCNVFLSPIIFQPRLTNN
jgi:hypothetical protein